MKDMPSSPRALPSQIRPERPQVLKENSLRPAALRYRNSVWWIRVWATVMAVYMSALRTIDIRLPGNTYITYPSAVRQAVTTANISLPLLLQPLNTTAYHAITFLVCFLPHTLPFLATSTRPRRPSLAILYGIYIAAWIVYDTWTWWIPFAKPGVGPWYFYPTAMSVYRTTAANTHTVLIPWDPETTELIPDTARTLSIFMMLATLSATAEVAIHWRVGGLYHKGKISLTESEDDNTKQEKVNGKIVENRKNK